MINIFENSIYHSLPLRWKSNLHCPGDIAMYLEYPEATKDYCFLNLHMLGRIYRKTEVFFMRKHSFRFFSVNTHIWNTSKTLFSCLRPMIWVICTKSGGTYCCNQKYNGMSPLSYTLTSSSHTEITVGASDLCVYP